MAEFPLRILNSCIIQWLHNYWEKIDGRRIHESFIFLRKMKERCRQTFHWCFSCFTESNCVFSSDSCFAWFIVRPLKQLYSWILRLFVLPHMAVPPLLFPQHRQPFILLVSQRWKKTRHRRKSTHNVPPWISLAGCNSHKAGKGGKFSCWQIFSSQYSFKTYRFD